MQPFFRRGVYVAGAVLFSAFFILQSLAAGSLGKELSGKILLQVESRGEAWYVTPHDGARIYLQNGAVAYQVMKDLGLGITNQDLAKIPVGIESRFTDTDSDGDGLSDKLEEGLKTNVSQTDSDGDGYTDGMEVASGYNPLGPGKQPSDPSVINRVRGKIVLQVEERGQAWYINPADDKRYYMPHGEAAYQIMRFLSLGITNANLNKIAVSSFTLPSIGQQSTLAGCSYHNPDCGSGYTCVANSCQVSVVAPGSTPPPAATPTEPAAGPTETEPTPTGCAYHAPDCGTNYTCVNNQCVLRQGCTYENPACGSGYECVNNSCQQTQSNYFTTKTFNLDVVFYNVTTCYVGDTCEDGDTCSTLKASATPHAALLTFKRGTLRMLNKARADSYGYGNTQGVKLCTSSSFPTAAKTTITNYVNEVSDLIYSWTKHGMKIVPRIHTVSADMGSGSLLNAEGATTGYETGRNPAPEQFIQYAKKSGVDTASMDLFLAFVNPYPSNTTTSPLVQSYIGETSGVFNGVGMVKMSGMQSATQPLSREWLVSAMLHELTHAVNLGHYAVSGLPDVYGIESSEQNSAYRSGSNTRPHCTTTNHLVHGTPDAATYFPDSYNWLDPMWNSKPFEPYTGTNATSYCLVESNHRTKYPALNPLDPTDRYSDVAGLSDHAKYYKFVYQAHYQDRFATTLFTSYCKNGKAETNYATGEHFEFSSDTGGRCTTATARCNSSGICANISFAGGGQETINQLPIKREGVSTASDSTQGTVGVFNGVSSRLLLTGAEVLSDSPTLTLSATVKLNSINRYQPLISNIDRYFLAVNGTTIEFTLEDYYLRDLPVVSQTFSVEAPTLNAGEWHTITATLSDKEVGLYLDGQLLGSQSNFFRGRFVPQDTGDYRAPLYIGHSLKNNSWLAGSIAKITIANRVIVE